MTDPDNKPKKFPVKGVALLGGALLIVVLIIVVGNSMLKKPSPQPLPQAAVAQGGVSPTPQSTAQSTAASVALAPVSTPVSTPASAPSPPAQAAFSPPPESSLPQDDYGKVVKRGEQIFMETGKYASRYVGNNLNCVNCHLDAGRKPDSAPMWAAFIHYPAYRNKTGQVDTLASRIQGCFEYSMNGKAPEANDEVITALQTYAFWLAKGAPVGMPVAGGGYPKLKKPALPADYVRGEKVYAQNCALCHGADGQGQRAGDKQVFPPLWGPKGSLTNNLFN